MSAKDDSELRDLYIEYGKQMDNWRNDFYGRLRSGDLVKEVLAENAAAEKRKEQEEKKLMKNARKHIEELEEMLAYAKAQLPPSESDNVPVEGYVPGTVAPK